MLACDRKQPNAAISPQEKQLVLNTLQQPANTSADAMNLRRTPVVVAVQSISPAVVNISTESVVRESLNPFGNDDFFGGNDFSWMFPQQDVRRQTLGSGVIIDKRGYILTNEHVVVKAAKITVTLPDHREFAARVIGEDSRFDLAILAIDVKGDMPAAKMGDSDDIMIGETVIAIGNPYGLEHTVTTGVVSAVHRSIRAEENRVYSDFIQTDTSINPGNSGGPLVNLAGEVIGVNTAIYAKAEGIGFAIPINRAKRAVADLLRFGEIKPATIGIRTQDLTPDLARQFDFTGSHGVVVAEVNAKGPGAKAGVQAGDIITEAGGGVVNSSAEFSDRVSAAMVDDTLTLVAYRQGRRMEFRVKAVALSLADADDTTLKLLGIQVAAVDRGSMSRYGLATDRGVVVTSVRPGSPLQRIGVRPGDVIRQLGDREINSLDDFRKAVLVAGDRTGVFVVIQRGNSLYYTTVQF